MVLSLACSLRLWEITSFLWASSRGSEDIQNKFKKISRWWRDNCTRSHIDLGLCPALPFINCVILAKSSKISALKKHSMDIC